MTTDVTATFEVTGWDERPFDDLQDVPKVTRAVVTRSYAGDVEGTSSTEWLMAYGQDGSATFVGLERIAGTVAGRKGTLVVRHVGTYGDGVARGTLDVVADVGSGDLRSVAGSGTFVADPSGSITLSLED